jgi:hypothetical protein
VLRFSGDVYVSAARYGDVVLWHDAFARHWFKVNLTTRRSGFAGRLMTSQDGVTYRAGHRWTAEAHIAA